MRLALLSDIHIPTDSENEFRGFRPYENFKTALAQVAAANTGGVIICGDLARDKGQAADYANLRRLLAPLEGKAPVTMALGNHDHRNNFLAIFGQQDGAQPVKGKHVSLVEGPVARLIVLDSLIETGTIAGFLGRMQRAWLDQFLKSAAPLPTLVFVHHNLDDDDNGLLDAPRLLAVVRPHAQVKAIVYGHTHRYRIETWDGIHIIGLPSTAYNFMDKFAIGWVEAELSAGGGRFTLHAIGGNKDGDGQAQTVKWR